MRRILRSVGTAFAKKVSNWYDQQVAAQLSSSVANMVAIVFCCVSLYVEMIEVPFGDTICSSWRCPIISERGTIANTRIVHAHQHTTSSSAGEAQTALFREVRKLSTISEAGVKTVCGTN